MKRRLLVTLRLECDDAYTGDDVYNLANDRTLLFSRDLLSVAEIIEVLHVTDAQELPALSRRRD